VGKSVIYKQIAPLALGSVAPLTLDLVPQVADPVTRTRATAGSAVSGVGEPASLQRQAAATDAFGEACPHSLQLTYPLVNPAGPTARELGPVRSFRHTIIRKFGKFCANLFETKPDSLSEDNERDAPQDGTPIASMPRACSYRLDQPPLLVKSQGRCRHTASTRYFADSKQVHI